MTKEYIRHAETFLLSKGGTASLDQILKVPGIPSGIKSGTLKREFNSSHRFVIFEDQNTCKVYLIGSDAPAPYGVPAMVPFFIFLIRFYDAAVRGAVAWPDTKQQLKSIIKGFAVGLPAACHLSNERLLEQLGCFTCNVNNLTWQAQRMEDLVRRAPPVLLAKARLPPKGALKVTQSNIMIDATNGVSNGAAQLVAAIHKSPPSTGDKIAVSASASASDDWRLANHGIRCVHIRKASDCHAFTAAVTSLLARNPNESTVVSFGGFTSTITVELLVIWLDKTCYLLDIPALTGAHVVIQTLRALFQSKDVIKVVHNLYKRCFHTNVDDVHDIESLLDSQLVGEHIYGESNIRLNAFLEKLEQSTPPNSSFFDARSTSQPDFWSRRPLPKGDLEQAALHVVYLGFASIKILNLIGNKKNDFFKASSLRLNSITTNGCKARAFCFDMTKNWKLASRELIEVLNPSDAYFGRTLVTESDVDDVIDLLPKAFLSKFKAFDNRAVGIRGLLTRNTHSVDRGTDVDAVDLNRLSDIVIDVGRRPQCWVSGKRILLNDDENVLVKQDDIQQIIGRLGEIGDDNRAGLDGKLHRFSVIRARGKGIAGVTIRLGRTVSGNADIFRDFLLGGDKSILFLGVPGSGKTTIVREVTRILAEEHHVLVVDTSNEIAGDGMIPHKCIGMARRMMVPTLDDQSDVMVECVQNHTPSCMVIDEIGRPKEVLAARTVKQRGVRIIASAHGDLRKLVKNKELRGLVGGVEAVVMGDAMAKEDAKRREKMMEKEGTEGVGGGGGVARGGGHVITPSKTKAQRASEPTFDVVVELRQGQFHEWHIITDTANAVDCILDGRDYDVEVRTRDPETGNLFTEMIRE